MMISTYDPTNRLIRVQELGYSDVTDYRISASGWRYWSKAGTANAIYSPRDGAAPLGEFIVGSFPFTWTLRRPDGSVYGRKSYKSCNELFWTDLLGYFSINFPASSIQHPASSIPYQPVRPRLGVAVSSSSASAT